MMAAIAPDGPDLSPWNGQGIGLMGLLFLSGGYGTVMLLRRSFEEQDCRPPDE
jgi:hypothetical protein